jgi:hypothetical protein
MKCQNIYKNVCSKCTVKQKWIQVLLDDGYKEAKTGGAGLHDKLHSSCPSAATVPDIYQVDKLTYSKLCVKTDVLFSILSLMEV